MAHEVNERELVYNVGNGVPWHGLGKAVEGLMTAPDAYYAAGLDWKVEQRPIFVGNDEEMVDEPTKGFFSKVPDRVANVRSDTGQYLGTVGHGYRPIQNSEQLEFIQALTGEGAAVVDVAGALSDGKRVFWALRVPGDLMIGGEDQIDKYLITANGHDGTLAFKAFWSPIRVVCANTLNASLTNKGTQGVSIRHTSGVKRHVDEARRVLKLADTYYESIADKFETLMASRVTDSKFGEYLERVIPDNEDAKKNTRTVNIRRKVRHNYNQAPGAGRVRGTAWGAYNAVTYYVTHQRTDVDTADRKTSENRFKSVLLGSGRTIQQRAFDAALLLAN